MFYTHFVISVVHVSSLHASPADLLRNLVFHCPRCDLVTNIVLGQFKKKAHSKYAKKTPKKRSILPNFLFAYKRRLFYTHSMYNLLRMCPYFTQVEKQETKQHCQVNGTLFNVPQFAEKYIRQWFDRSILVIKILLLRSTKCFNSHLYVYFVFLLPYEELICKLKKTLSTE